MAQKELLFFLMLLTLMPLLLCVGIAKAKADVSAVVSRGEVFDFKKKDLEFAKEITERSMQITLPEIRAKWFELQNMLGEGEGLTDFNKEVDCSTSFRIFVSSSMSKNLLRRCKIITYHYCGII